MRVTKDAVELARGNIRIQFPKETVLAAIRTVKSADAELEKKLSQRGYDPTTWVPYPGNQNPQHARVTETWRGSGKKAREGVRTTIRKNGITTSPDVHSLADFLNGGGTFGG